jgi:chromosome segregation ATPase
MVSLRSGCDGEDGEAWDGETDVLRPTLQTVTRLCKGLKVKSAVLEEQVESLKARQEHSHARETELRAQTEAAAQCRQTLEKEREQWAQERAQLQETIEQLQRRHVNVEASCSLWSCLFPKGVASGKS